MTAKPKRSPKIICISSGKGGVGKTSFSVNVATALSQKGKAVLLIDGEELVGARAALRNPRLPAAKAQPTPATALCYNPPPMAELGKHQGILPCYVQSGGGPVAALYERRQAVAR